MKPPIFIRSLTNDERKALQAGLRSSNAFTLRRCQIVLQSAEGRKPSEIARMLNCAVQTVRNVIKAFNAQSVVCLQEQSHKPKTVEPIFTADKREKLRALLHQSPRQYGQVTST